MHFIAGCLLKLTLCCSDKSCAVIVWLWNNFIHLKGEALVSSDGA